MIRQVAGPVLQHAAVPHLPIGLAQPGDRLADGPSHGFVTARSLDDHQFFHQLHPLRGRELAADRGRHLDQPDPHISATGLS